MRSSTISPLGLARARRLRGKPERNLAVYNALPCLTSFPCGTYDRAIRTCVRSGMSGWTEPFEQFQEK
jgi:hypothetical protein